MNSVVKVRNIKKFFNKNKEKKFKVSSSEKSGNKFFALEDVSFDVNQGEMLGIIGLNGSGKSTLLRVIAGILEPDGGSVEINGRLAPLLQIGIGFQNELIASENIVLSGMLSGMSKEFMLSKISAIIEFAGLQKFSNMKLKHYSSGMRSRLAFSTAIQLNPDILLVDEILSVGDIKFKEKSYQAFLDFKKKNNTIIYTSHNLGMMPKLCDRVLILHHGKVVNLGNPTEMINQYKKLTSAL